MMTLELTPVSLRGLQVCVLYAVVSLSLSTCNKMVLTTFGFGFTFTLLTLQFTFTIVAVMGLRAARSWGRPCAAFPVTNALSITHIRWTMPLVLLNLGNVVCGFYGLRLVSIPMFLCLRRTTTAFALALEFVLLNRIPEPFIALSVLLVCVGAVVAGAGSLQADFAGFLWTFGNNILTASFLTVGANSMDVLLYNALGGLPISLVMVWASGEVGGLLSYEQYNDAGFWVALFVSTAMGVLIAFAVSLCATYNSPLATVVTGNVKDVVGTLLGWALFGDFVATANAVLGLLLSFFGAALYSFGKLQQATKQQQSKADKPEGAEAVALVAVGKDGASV